MNRARLIENLDYILSGLSGYEPQSLGIRQDRRHHAKRIRSIIRRLKRCPVCLGRHVVYINEMGFEHAACQRCNGTGRVANVQIQQ